MKRFYKFAMLTVATVLLTSCGGKTEGSADEVLSKKAYSKAVVNYKSIDDFYEGVAIVSNDGLYGVINAKGKEIVPCQYDDLGECTNGFMWFKEVDKDYHSFYGYLNNKGEVIIPADYIGLGSFSDNGLARVQVMLDKDGSRYDVENIPWGYINTKGEEVIAPKYQNAGDFVDGLAPVKIEGKWGYINKKEEFVLPANFDKAYVFNDGAALVEKDGKEYMINTDGEIVFTLKENQEFLDYSLSDGLIPIYDNDKGHVMYYNNKGEVAIDTEFAYGTPFEDGKAAVYLDKKVQVINTKGKVIEEEITDLDLLEYFIDEAEDIIDIPNRYYKLID